MTLLTRNIAWLVSIGAFAYGARDYRAMAAGNPEGSATESVEISLPAAGAELPAPMATLALRGPISRGIVIPAPGMISPEEELRDAPRNSPPPSSRVAAAPSVARVSARSKPAPEDKARVLEREIAAAVKSVIAYKGRPWTVSEYNAEAYYAAISLREKGASAEQVKRFQRMIDEAPARNGGFKLASGD